MEPTYGASGRYQAERGQEYFDWQSAGAEPGAALELFKFEPYIGPTDSVLDFGCSGGWILSKLVARKKAGVELNPAARMRCKAVGIDVYPDIADVPDEFLPTVIISNHCLEHVPYPIEALRRLREKSAPGATLVLCVPLDDWRSRHQSNIHAEDINNHLHTWTPLLLRNTLKEAGWRTRDVKVLVHALPPKHPLWAHRVPAWTLQRLCWLTSVLRRQRQLLAVAVNHE